jgi:hypothetical protein
LTMQPHRTTVEPPPNEAEARARARRRLALGTPLCLFAIACVTPSIELGDRWPGFGCVLLGWIAVLEGVPAWLANPVVIAAWICLRQRFYRVAAALAAIAAVLALSTCMLFRREIVIADSGATAKLSSLDVGFYLWMASMISVLAIALVLRSREGSSSSRLPVANP